MWRPRPVWTVPDAFARHAKLSHDAHDAPMSFDGGVVTPGTAMRHRPVWRASTEVALREPNALSRTGFDDPRPG